MSDGEASQPTINFGGEQIPAHEAWGRLETLSTATDLLDRFNADHPDLATEFTVQVVETVRHRLQRIQLTMPAKGGNEGGDTNGVDEVNLAKELLAKYSPEEVLEMLEAEHGVEMNIHALSQAAAEAYVQALAREAVELEANMVLPDQMADLWNELGRPAPGGGLWTTSKVHQLIKS